MGRRRWLRWTCVGMFSGLLAYAAWVVFRPFPRLHEASLELRGMTLDDVEARVGAPPGSYATPASRWHRAAARAAGPVIPICQ